LSYFRGMTNEKFQIVADLIKKRRTVKAEKMNGKQIPDEQINQLLELADWAPNHGNTEPWRFVVYADAKAFCQQHAELYKNNTLPENFVQATYEKFASMGELVSHAVIAINSRGHLPKIPVWEEITATACGLQNLLIGATALDIVAFWSTGGRITDPSMKTFLGLREEDMVMGVLYLGYADAEPAGKRNIPMADKVKWVKG